MGKTVMIVDDDISILRMIRLALKNEKYSVVTAQNGKIALDKINEATVDLVVTDVMMPMIGGLELVRALKRQKSTADIPVIVLTSLHKYDDMKSGYNLGADFYITKPFDIDELITAVRQLLTENPAEEGA